MSNPDKDFPNDTDRFTPMEMPVVPIPKYPPEDSLDLLDGEETGVPFGLEQEAYGTPQTWAQQVEAESATAGPEEKPFSPPWPPLSQEQVVELHKALVEFVSEMAAARRPMSDDDQQTVIWCVATGLHGILERLHIGTPQPPPRQEENLGGFACLDERRMGPPLDADVQTMRGTLAELEEIQRQRDAHQRQRRAQAMEPETSDRLERIQARLNAKPEVKHNCWTCANNQGPRNDCAKVSSRFGREDVEAWLMRQTLSEPDSEHPNMPPKDSDGCPGWTPKS